MRWLALACAAGCGGDESPTADAAPQGPHHRYVVDAVSVPSTIAAADASALDLDGDGQIDNRLGRILATLAGQGFEIQPAMDQAVARGGVIHLVDIQATGLADASDAGLSIELGASPVPPACSDASDPTCRHHLMGTASFEVTGSTSRTMIGAIEAGTFAGGPGRLSLQIAIGGPSPIRVDLIGARARASRITADAIGELLLGGAVPRTDLVATVFPAIADQLDQIVQRDCLSRQNPPGCGCITGTPGKLVTSLFDTSPKECRISTNEVENNSLIAALSAPDVTIDGVPALSLGLGATAVHATY